jgi:hypothetical protein
MPVTDEAVLLPGVGHALLGTVGATKPSLSDLTSFAADTSDLPTGFTNLGHTDLDQILQFGTEGGDTTTKGSWQNPALREIVTVAKVDYIILKSLQILDNTVLSLYHGGGSAATANEFAWPDNPTPTEKALALIMLDGDTPICLYAQKVSIRAESELEFASDDFTKAPLRLTFLKNGSNPRAVWIADAIGSA